VSPPADIPTEVIALVQQRRVSAIAADPVLADQHLDRARTTLDQALLLTDPGLRERLRYEAGLHLALAVMAADGYRLRSGPGHHETAIAYLRSRLGAEPGITGAVRVLDMTRRNRNSELYRAVPVGSTSAQASAAALDVLAAAVSDLVREAAG
jgi:hypothetical protein